MESSTTTKAVIYNLKQHFARHGILNTVFSENGPKNSEKFSRFSRDWEFHHVTSSPGHVQSISMVESAVKTAKRLIKKANKDKTDLPQPPKHAPGRNAKPSGAAINKSSDQDSTSNKRETPETKTCCGRRGRKGENQSQTGILSRQKCQRFTTTEER